MDEWDKRLLFEMLFCSIGIISTTVAILYGIIPVTIFGMIAGLALGVLILVWIAKKLFPD